MIKKSESLTIVVLVIVFIVYLVIIAYVVYIPALRGFNQGSRFASSIDEFTKSYCRTVGPSLSQFGIPIPDRTKEDCRKILTNNEI